MRTVRLATLYVVVTKVGKASADVPFLINGSMPHPWWSEEFWQQVLVFVIALCLGEWLRTVINGIHQNKTGEPHPTLRRWLSI